MARVLPMAGVRPGAHHEVATLGWVGNDVGHALGARVVWAGAVGPVRGHVIVGAREDMAHAAPSFRLREIERVGAAGALTL
eukprot:CAMPEP_0118846732 /NCGR_PEP_ID=MMETSP1162-20130426/92611_1 /TAXON_ID=33656 /ORGANISM="Phaeocystis Sp, Strain CCMP2710" /LENGTH=80 /DNA_ID=CAMNT_0006778917 /DNA_START=158 /DNA_END=400 /DNA_ORIENTATION=-